MQNLNFNPYRLSNTQPNFKKDPLNIGQQKSYNQPYKNRDFVLKSNTFTNNKFVNSKHLSQTSYKQIPSRQFSTRNNATDID